jgi:DUF4097 and DUF4098 domain-containing protein YvlB
MRLTSILLLLTSCATFAATEERITTNFSATAGGTLVVDVGLGSVEVTTNATLEVVVDTWRRVTRQDQAREERFLAENPVTIVQEGNTVTVRCSHREERFGWFSGWFRGWGDRNEAKYTIRVPAQFNGRLNTAGGSIAVSDLSGAVAADTSGGALRFVRIHGPLRGNTSGGEIKVVDCVGDIKVDTSGGAINLAGGSGAFKGETSGGAIAVETFHGPVSVETSGGGIRIENVNGKVIGDTSGGPIMAILPAPVPDDVKLSTSGGGVTVKVPENAAFNLDAEASGGGISCDLPVTVQGKMERDRLKGPVNGGGPTLRLQTSGGGIRVKKL